MNEPAGEPKTSSILKSVRADLLIAVSALLISTLATAASWWQTRASWEQTQIIEEQLSAQVWPYVDVGINYNGTTSTAEVQIANQGLGPAVLRSATVFVKGKPEANFIDVLHALVGPDLMGRKPRGENIGLDISAGGPGAVLRPGETTTAFALTSKHFAREFVRNSDKLDVRLCYCAIIPGKCWQSDSATGSADPAPVPSCAEISNDVLHSQPARELFSKF